MAGCVLIAATILVRLAVIGHPFAANNESTACAPLLSVARNYVRYGPGAVRLGGIMNSGRVLPENWSIYANHPPLVPLSIAAVQGVAGVSEWTARAVPVFFSVASTALLYLIVGRRFGARAGIVAGFLYAFCPLTLVFGGMPDYVGAPLVFFGLAATESYVRWTETGERRWVVGLVVSFLLGALSDWPVFFLLPLFAVHQISRPPRRLLGALCAVAAATLLLGGLGWWAEWVSRGHGDWTSAGGDFSFLDQFARRTLGGLDDGGNRITLGRWVGRVVVEHEGVLHTWPVLVLAAVYIVQTGRRGARREWAVLRTHLAPLLLLSWGTLHLTVGIQGNFQHAWWSVLLTPGLAAAAALAIESLVAAAPENIRGRGLGVALAAGTAAVFVASSGFAAYRYSTEFGNREETGYTLKALGAAIQSIAADDEGVLTSEMNPEPALWFYADRQLRPTIRSVEDLDRSLTRGRYDLPYGYIQRDGPAPRWFVMPAPHRMKLAPLAAALDARFPHRAVDGFTVYQLR